MTEDNPDTKNDKWTQLVVRVTAWLLLPFWSETDDEGKTCKKRDFQKESIETYVKLGNEGSDVDKKSYMSIINAIARSLKDLCPLPSGAPKDSTVANITEEIMNDPQKLLALMTLREGKVKIHGEATKIVHRRIKAQIKALELKGEDVVEQFMAKLKTGMETYPSGLFMTTSDSRIWRFVGEEEESEMSDEDEA